MSMLRYYQNDFMDQEVTTSGSGLGFALKNTSEMLFITWMVVSAKQPGFDYSRIPEFYTTLQG